MSFWYSLVGLAWCIFGSISAFKGERDLFALETAVGVLWFIFATLQERRQ